MSGWAPDEPLPPLLDGFDLDLIAELLSAIPEPFVPFDNVPEDSMTSTVNAPSETDIPSKDESKRISQTISTRTVTSPTVVLMKPPPFHRISTGTLPIQSLPTIHIKRASDEVDPCADIPLDERAKWTCCHCHCSNCIFAYTGPHLIGALTCTCPHKPCSNCSVSGIVKPFSPMEEPAVVPVSEYNKQVWFGTACAVCGLSWRAMEIKRHSRLLRKMPSLGRLHQVRLTGTEKTLRKVRSQLAMNRKRNFTPPGSHEKQAEFAAVKFGGFECTCGEKVIASKALCFQVTGKPTRRVEGEEEKGDGRGWWTTMPELQAKGHGQTVVEILGIRHVNPLRSCPVDLGEAEEARFLARMMGGGQQYTEGKTVLYLIWLSANTLSRARIEARLLKMSRSRHTRDMKMTDGLSID